MQERALRWGLALQISANHCSYVFLIHWKATRGRNTPKTWPLPVVVSKPNRSYYSPAKRSFCGTQYQTTTLRLLWNQNGFSRVSVGTTRKKHVFWIVRMESYKLIQIWKKRTLQKVSLSESKYCRRLWQCIPLSGWATTQPYVGKRTRSNVL